MAKPRLILDETEVDYRNAVALNPPSLIIALLLMSLGAASFIPATTVSLEALSMIAMVAGAIGMVEIGWRANRGWLWSERLPRWAQVIARRGRVSAGDFEFILTTALSATLNQALADTPGHENVLPYMTPRLRDLENGLLTTTAVADIRDRVLERPGIILGISGSRGAGKTFALEYLRRFSPKIGQILFLRLPAPKARANLSRFMLAALAEKLADPFKPTRTERIATHLKLAAASFVVLFSLTYLAVSFNNGDGGSRWWESFELAWDSLIQMTLDQYLLILFLLLAASLVLLALIFLYQELALRAQTSALAHDILTSLRFDDEKETGASLQFAFNAGAQLGANLTSRRALRGRQLDVGDVYATFERLVASYVKGTHKRVLIIIDELDRYEVDSDDTGPLNEALNQIKPFFLIRGVSSVMSVSTQAMNRFRKRDQKSSLGVLDSTFDEMVEMPAWGLEDTGRLLNRLVVGLSAYTIQRIHELSQGRPREALRIAWLICRLRAGSVPLELRGFWEPPPVPALAAEAGAPSAKPEPLEWAKCIELVEQSLSGSRSGSAPADPSSTLLSDRSRPTATTAD